MPPIINLTPQLFGVEQMENRIEIHHNTKIIRRSTEHEMHWNKSIWFFFAILLLFLQKCFFVLSAYSLILMGALQFKDHTCIQGENSFLVLYLILPHCLKFSHPKSHDNNRIHASEPMRNYYRLTMTPTKGLGKLLNWSMWSNSTVENV